MGPKAEPRGKDGGRQLARQLALQCLSGPSWWANICSPAHRFALGPNDATRAQPATSTSSSISAGPVGQHTTTWPLMVSCATGWPRALAPGAHSRAAAAVLPGLYLPSEGATGPAQIQKPSMLEYWRSIEPGSWCLVDSCELQQCWGPISSGAFSAENRRHFWRPFLPLLHTSLSRNCLKKSLQREAHKRALSSQ